MLVNAFDGKILRSAVFILGLLAPQSVVYKREYVYDLP